MSWDRGAREIGRRVDGIEGDNEARSAELAEACLRSTPFAPLVPRLRSLILLTAKHGQHVAAELDHDASHFLDCDMAILGSAEADYAVYERAIAEEYAFLPRETYRAGRARFLARLLESPRIYLSDFFHAEREAAARRNVERELARLEGRASRSAPPAGPVDDARRST